MNIEQVRAAAEAQSPNLSNPSCIKIYVGSAAADSNADRIAGLFQSAVDQDSLHAGIIRAGSFGFYDLEPIVAVERPGSFTTLYANVTPDIVADFIDDVVKGVPEEVKALGCICNNNRELSGITNLSALPLFTLQSRIALRNCGWIDPEDINHYITHGQGYAGLSKALGMNPSEIIGAMIPSALKGRGGQGCSTADKWELFSASKNADKYFICNAVDPDTRSLASRLLLESDPHSVLEGMLIGAYAAGALRCFIFVEEMTAAGRKLKNALGQMRQYNLLGPNILDSEFCLEIEIEEVPSSLPAGHRIELFRCLEESQPLLHMHPSYPAASEFIGMTVLTANPEIMSSLSAILCDDMKACRESKVVTLSGSAAHKYTVEVSPEMTIRSIIENFGGGISNGKAIKAVQLGGPAGPFIGPNALDLPIGCAAREKSISCIGSGSIEILDAGVSIVYAVKEIMSYIQAQSCGKCVFCREGCLQMLTILEDISENKGHRQDLDLLIELGEEMLNACLCDFGRAAPNPVLSSIKLFRNEYEKRFPVQS
jgi:NADH-quinone oxidoreductase subunit F